MLYVSLSGGVVQESFVAALDARGVPLTHLLRPADAPAELVAWIRERGDARTGADPRARQGSATTRRRTDSVLVAIDAALRHVTPTTYGRHTRRVA